MALSNVSSWIFSIILLNHGIITVTSFPGIIEFGLELLMVQIFGMNDKQADETSMDDLASKIDNLENTIRNSEKRIIAEVDQLIKSNEAMSNIHKALSDIIFHSKYFEEDMTDSDTEQELVSFAQKCVTRGDGSLTYLLHNVMQSVKPTVGMRDLPLFETVVQPYLDEGKAAGRCGRTISVQQEVYKMFGIVSMYVIKGYDIILKSYDTLNRIKGARYARRKKRTMKNLEDDLSTIAKSAIEAMLKAPRDFRSCDPEFHEKGGTYIQLRELFDTTLVLETLLWGGDCYWTCEDYKKTVVLDIRDKSMSCPGTYYNCTSTEIKSYRVAEGSDRRYDAVSTTPLRGKVDRNDRNIHRSWSSRFRWCDACACTCDKSGHPDTVRWFSLVPMQSSSEENRVITGLRFVEIESIIYIQIQEGKLQSEGRVIASTLKWQPVNESSKEDSWQITYEQKSVNLDTLVAPHLQVMTGIKFSVLDSRLTLSIRAHEFDYSSGVLHNGDGSWISNEITDREEIKIGKVANPLDADGENIVALGENEYVEFTMTDWDYDLTQVAVPFIDAQPLIIDPPLPLAGAGIYYRGRSEYGGFIALELVALDYAKMLYQIAFDRVQHEKLSNEDHEEDHEGDHGEDHEGDHKEDHEEEHGGYHEEDHAGYHEEYHEEDHEKEHPKKKDKERPRKPDREYSKRPHTNRNQRLRRKKSKNTLIDTATDIMSLWSGTS